MPTRRTYDLRITNTFTDETAEYNAPDLLGCRDAINQHFGCTMITKHGVVNLMVRGRQIGSLAFALPACNQTREGGMDGSVVCCFF